MDVFGRPRGGLYCRDGDGVGERENMTLCTERERERERPTYRLRIVCNVHVACVK